MQFEILKFKVKQFFNKLLGKKPQPELTVDDITADFKAKVEQLNEVAIKAQESANLQDEIVAAAEKKKAAKLAEKTKALKVAAKIEDLLS